MGLTFEAPMDFEDIEEGVLLDEGDYEFRLAKPIEILANAEKRKMEAGEDFDEQRVGENIVVTLATQGHPEEDFNGREFLLYLPLPKPGDEDVIDRRGMKLSHKKLRRIKNTCEALGGRVEGNTAMWPDEGLCKGHIIKAFPYRWDPMQHTEGENAAAMINEITGDIQPLEVAF